MATTEQAELRREVGEERDKLAEAVEDLRTEFVKATDVGSRIMEHLPLAAGAAFTLGFLRGGGPRAIVRLLRD